ncbi:MAG: porin family protein [Hyphomicrobiaceae bacterium]|nr:porin family protein [Hyphomicrobiaceae bacterium]
MRFVHSAIAAISLVGLAAATAPASAGDLFGRGAAGSIKDDYYDPPKFSWTGFYIGAHAGLAVGDTQGGENLGPIFATDFEMNGAMYGAHVGYNYQMNNLVVGIEGTFDGTEIDGNTTCVFVLNCQREVNWVATIVGRLGYAMDRSMIYGFGGVSFADVDTTVSIAGVPILSGGETHTGWVAGIGFSYAISNNVIARIEYAHMDFGSESHNLLPAGIPDDVSADIDTIRLGVSFKFGGDRYVAPMK